jgi:hypothetical protein
MDSLCIVTGISSNEPYFELGFQLIESIKATQHYANIPIKVLDCGLSQEHREILKSYFDLEIKDPAWDIEPSLITSSPHFIKFENLSSWKGCTARPYLAKHFPGYGYYLWIDADTWINDEQILDKLIVFAENQEIGCLSESKPVSRSIIRRSLTREQLCRFGKETLIINGLFCLSRGAIDEYAAHAGQQIDLLGRYGWGFDMAVFNLMFYEKYSTAKTLLFTGIDSDLVGPLSVYILYGRYKHLGYMHISSGRLLLKMQIIFRAWGRMYEGLLLMTNRLSGAVPVSYRFREFHTQSPGQPSL